MLLDHESLEATNVAERFSILNAYHLPGVPEGVLYPRISPVNSFRVVLSHYFDIEYELLDDRSYFSTWSEPLIFQDVTSELQREKALVHAE